MTSTTARSSPALPPASASFSGSEILAEAVQRDAEEQVFARTLADVPDPSLAPSVLILGAPRTGSTLLYQAMVRFFRLPYFSNLANDVFPTRPALAAPLHPDMLPPINAHSTTPSAKPPAP